MHRDQRLTRASDFAAARRERNSWANSILVLMLRPNDLDVSRFGFSVGRRVGKAVVRNKVRRRLREAARLASVRKGWDLVVIARKDASSADFHQLRHSLTRLFSRAGVLEAPPQHPCSPPKAN